MTDASTTSTFGSEQPYGVLTGQASLVLALDPIEYFIECWRVGDQSELGKEKLLE